MKSGCWFSTNIQGTKHISSFLLNGQQFFRSWFYRWCRVSQQYRTIQTIVGKYAEATTGIVINNEVYLALACSGRSTLLKHNGRVFVQNKTLPTHDSLSVAFVSDSPVDPVTRQNLLAFSSYSYRTRYDLPSYFYRWNNSTQRFGIYKSLPSTGATNIRFFSLTVNFI